MSLKYNVVKFWEVIRYRNISRSCFKRICIPTKTYFFCITNLSMAYVSPSQDKALRVTNGECYVADHSIYMETLPALLAFLVEPPVTH